MWDLKQSPISKWTEDSWGWGIIGARIFTPSWQCCHFCLRVFPVFSSIFWAAFSLNADRNNAIVLHPWEIPVLRVYREYLVGLGSALWVFWVCVQRHLQICWEMVLHWQRGLQRKQVGEEIACVRCAQAGLLYLSAVIYGAKVEEAERQSRAQILFRSNLAELKVSSFLLPAVNSVWEWGEVQWWRTIPSGRKCCGK